MNRALGKENAEKYLAALVRPFPGEDATQLKVRVEGDRWKEKVLTSD